MSLQQFTGGQEPFSIPYSLPIPEPSSTVLDTQSTLSIPGVDAPDIIVETAVANTTDDSMKQVKTKATIGLLSSLIAYVSFNSFLKSFRPDLFVWYAEDREEPQWMSTSKSWLDRKACRWLSICGASHLHFVGPKFGHRPHHPHRMPAIDDNGMWEEAAPIPEWSDDEKILRNIPEYIFEYAPLVHLYSGEQFWPCDMADHLSHITPRLNYTPIKKRYQHPSLHNLSHLNKYEKGRNVFLTSNDNVEERPDWLEGEKNIPNMPSDDDSNDQKYVHTAGKTAKNYEADEGPHLWLDGDPDHEDLGDNHFLKDAPIPIETNEGDDFRAEQDPFDPETTRLLTQELQRRSTTTLRGGRSDAPAVLVTVEKGRGIIDAFWFFFYSFNLGNAVLNVRFGNHIGDWEHSVVRFQDGIPKAVYFSEHNFGSSYSYQAVEKLGKRPIIYSASGTHAMYATPGTHSYVLPWGLLHDVTDRGPLWDPVLNSHTYTYDYVNDTLRASNHTPSAPTSWFYFNGHWGDKFYPLGDSRQYRFAGQYHYVNGPIGPRFKGLGRRHVCPGRVTDPCVTREWLQASNGKAKRWNGPLPGEGDEMSEEDLERFVTEQGREQGSVLS